eukprot:scaffold50756_cov46-Attheya_sp.AAC.2
MFTIQQNTCGPFKAFVMFAIQQNTFFQINSAKQHHDIAITMLKLSINKAGNIILQAYIEISGHGHAEGTRISMSSYA